MSRVVMHPSATQNPTMTVAEAMGMTDQMADCIIMFTDHDGKMHVAWSNQGNADLAAYGVALTHIAASRLIDDDE